MQKALTKGRAYPQPCGTTSIDNLPPAEASVCAFPTPPQIDTLAAVLAKYAARVVSVGCGSGYLEGLLQRKGVALTAVDLDYLSQGADYARETCYCDRIIRVRSWQLFDLGAKGSDTALLFCFGRRVPWREYLEAHPLCPLVVIIATECDLADPACGALRNDSRWCVELSLPVRGVTQSVTCVCYVRRATAAATVTDSVSPGRGRTIASNASRQALVNGETTSVAATNAAISASPVRDMLALGTRSKFWEPSADSGNSDSDSDSDSDSTDDDHGDDDEQHDDEADARSAELEVLAVAAATAQKTKLRLETLVREHTAGGRLDLSASGIVCGELDTLVGLLCGGGLRFLSMSFRIHCCLSTHPEPASTHPGRSERELFVARPEAAPTVETS